MSIIETFTKIINRGKAKTENVRTSDYVIGDFPFTTPDAISAESAMRISTVYSCIRVRAESIAMLPLRLYEISKDGSRKQQRRLPCHVHIVARILKEAGKSDKDALSEDGRKAVECASDADKAGLFTLVKCQHIESVSRDVMRRGGKGSYPEERQRRIKERRAGDSFSRNLRKQEREHQHGCRHYALHGDDPPPLGSDDVHERAPEGLDDPWKIKHAGIQGQLTVRHAHVLEHDHGYVVDYEIWDSLCKIQGRDP